MTIRDITHEIFNQNTDYARPEQAINQSQSLNALSRDLYTDAKRFIYELLQNADDSAIPGNQVKVSIRLFDNYLVVAHSGRPFEKRDLRGLCGVNDGTKKNSPDKTGFKGIGFKAVFGQSDIVIVFSEGEYFRFDAGYQHDWPIQWGESQQAWEAENDRLFEFPWQIIPIYTKPESIPPDINNFLVSGHWKVATIVTLNNTHDTIEAIRILSVRVNMFLFLKNIEEIDFNVGEPHLISIGRLQNHEVILKLNGVPKARWLIKNINLAIPTRIKASLQADQNIPPKLKSANQIELTLAAKIGDNGIEALQANERLLYAYLPTEEQKYSIPVLVNTAFLTVANRESLHADSIWNQWLFNNIPKELFKWIAELVIGDARYQAYKILPDRLSQKDALTTEFNNGFDESILNTPFVITGNNTLLLVKEAIIDFTFLSDKPFIGRTPLRTFTIDSNGLSNIHANPFVANTGSGNKLKMLGVATFEWHKVVELLSSDKFIAQHSFENNIELIRYLKILSEAEKPSDVNDTVLKKWPFILDHKNKLKAPKDIFSPAPDDMHWNSPESELSFLHPRIQEWLLENQDIKIWLDDLGVVEKSDLTYLQKTILPNASNFITVENAIPTIQNVFYLYQKGDINNEFLAQLGKLKLLTSNNTLLPASECYLSERYLPRTSLEKSLNLDFYLNSNYLPANADIAEWKRFFKRLGVKDGFPILNYLDRTTVTKLTAINFSPDYFTLDDKKFKPAYSWFTASEYSELTSIFLLPFSIDNIDVAKLLWTDVIKFLSVQDLSTPAIAYWGNRGYPGWSTGDSVPNYVQWFVKNFACIPTKNATCQSSSNVFLNEDQIETIGGKYLPIFDGEQLSSDWRSFFLFKTKLELQDYLNLLTSISEDNSSENKKRIQLIYEYLLNNCINWSTIEQDLVKEWSITGKLLDQNGIFRYCTELKHYIDGDNSIFQNAYYFINLNKSNQQQPSLSSLLSLFQVRILRQSVFELKSTNCTIASGLTGRIKQILPYWGQWMAGEVQGGFEQRIYELEQKFQDIEIFQADELVITYGEDWSKKVNLHFLNAKLYVLNPWDSTKAMLTLPDKLCEYFDALGYQSQLSFLLKSTEEEIREYFEAEGIDLPPIETGNPDTDETGIVTANANIAEIKHVIDYHALWQENLKRNKALVADAKGDPHSLLMSGLRQNSPDAEVMVYHFTHLENAVSIIKDGAIKSRYTASFKDSAGIGIINQTEEERKQFARFYFRSQTPTQYYVENWGRGQDALDKLKSEPVCPIPIFFIIPLNEAMAVSDWNVSLGTLASPQVEFGNSFELVSKFDFQDLYKSKQDISHDRFMVSAAQEFLIKEQLPLSGLNYRIAVQDNNAKEALLAMLSNDTKWSNKIDITTNLYHNGNPKVNIHVSQNSINATFSERIGNFVLQNSGDGPLLHLNSDENDQFRIREVTTTISHKSIALSSDSDDIKYNLFYCYKGHLWLVHTNTDVNNFNGGYIKEALSVWLSNAGNPGELIQILKTHPELNFWYDQGVGGPDKLTLEEHTLAVIKNYLLYFENKQSLFATEQVFILFLALHDIGKPLAISLGDKTFQHIQSPLIIDRIKDILPVDTDTVERIKTLIDGDIIGKYMNPKITETLDATIEAIGNLATNLSMTVAELWPSLVMYYQCDAAGYHSLRQRLFQNSEEDKLELKPDGSRLLFIEELEMKFTALEEKIERQ